AAADAAGQSPAQRTRHPDRSTAGRRPCSSGASLADRRAGAAAQHRHHPLARLRRGPLRGAGRRRPDRRRPRRPARRPERAGRLRRPRRQGLPPAGAGRHRPHRAGVRSGPGRANPAEPDAAAAGREDRGRRRRRAEALVEGPAVRPHPDRRALLGQRRAAPAAGRAPAPARERRRHDGRATAPHPRRAVAAAGAGRAAALHHLLAAARGERGDRRRTADATGRCAGRAVHPARGSGRGGRLADSAGRRRSRRHVLRGTAEAGLSTRFMPKTASADYDEHSRLVVDGNPYLVKSPVPLSRARPLWLRDARWELAIFGAFALLLLGAGLGLRDPWPSDEPRFALVAHWMVEHGQWLFPHRGHELYPDKPPVFMWLQALAYLLTRSWRVAFLLPSLLAGLGVLALVYDLARRLWNHRSALLATATLLVTIHFTYQMRNAQIDPLLLGWITLANYGLLRHLLLGPSWRWFAVGCFFAGVGVATKGVGVLALLMLVPYLIARRGGWHHAARPAGDWRWAGGVAMFLLPILAWLLPMLLVARADGDPQHAAYVQNILFGQTVHRYATPT